MKELEIWISILEALEQGVWCFWVLPEEIVYVPIPMVCHPLHCEDGPAFESMDLKLWYIDRILVDEQIVMRPETQTVTQIDAEQNGDVRSIRIDRFGWPRYLKETASTVRHARKNEVEGTREAVYRTPNGEQRLVVTCPTGRVFALGIPNQIETCEQAQWWLAGDKKFNVIART